MQALLHSAASAFELPVRVLKGEAPEPLAASQHLQPSQVQAGPTPMQQAPRRGGPARGQASSGRGPPARGHITAIIGGRGLASQRGRGPAPRCAGHTIHPHSLLLYGSTRLNISVASIVDHLLLSSGKPHDWICCCSSARGWLFSMLVHSRHVSEAAKF